MDLFKINLNFSFKKKEKKEKVVFKDASSFVSPVTCIIEINEIGVKYIRVIQKVKNKVEETMIDLPPFMVKDIFEGKEGKGMDYLRKKIPAGIKHCKLALNADGVYTRYVETHVSLLSGDKAGKAEIENATKAPGTFFYLHTFQKGRAQQNRIISIKKETYGHYVALMKMLGIQVDGLALASDLYAFKVPATKGNYAVLFRVKSTVYAYIYEKNTLWKELRYHSALRESFLTPFSLDMMALENQGKAIGKYYIVDATNSLQYEFHQMGIPYESL